MAQDDVLDELDAPDEPPPAPVEPEHCRHCGQPNDTAEPGADFLCPKCEHYQNTVQCPTCKQPVDVGMLPAEMVPEAHAPARRRKG